MRDEDRLKSCIDNLRAWNFSRTVPWMHGHQWWHRSHMSSSPQATNNVKGFSQYTWRRACCTILASYQAAHRIYSTVAKELFRSSKPDLQDYRMMLFGYRELTILPIVWISRATIYSVCRQCWRFFIEYLFKWFFLFILQINCIHSFCESARCYCSCGRSISFARTEGRMLVSVRFARRSNSTPTLSPIERQSTRLSHTIAIFRPASVVTDLVLLKRE